MKEQSLAMTPGTFFIGTNYWASHAGTAMWRDWQPAVVEEDLRKLSEGGMEVLRIFPLWPDFQPLTHLRTAEGHPVEFSHGEEFLGDDVEGKAGICKESIEKFDEFLEIAQRNGLKVIIGLITGWMSGRHFVPPALEGRAIISDPIAIMWQVRLVQYFVKRYQHSEAVAAWDLGNECNVMGGKSRAEAWTWTASIVNGIRSIDTERPILSGMHSLLPEGTWTIQDQGELTDVLTTHPYPIFTPYCDFDPVNTIRTILHATAETRFYSDLSGKPCFAEELGTLGPMVAGEEEAADFIRATLFSLWAHDGRGMLWWCANDQDHLTGAPYDWKAVERELGMIRGDGTAKPVMHEMKRFRNMIEKLPLQGLPERMKEGVCIVSEDQDYWGVALSSFILSKQAGLDIEFQYADQELKDSDLYLLPCVSGHTGMKRRRLQKLLDRVADGASLYISINDGFISGFQSITGLRIKTRHRRAGSGRFQMAAGSNNIDFHFWSPFKLDLEASGAEVLVKEEDGNPVFTCYSYGKGKVYFLNFPLEMNLIKQAEAFDGHIDYWKIYDVFADQYTKGKAVVNPHSQVGVTEHPLEDGKRVVVMLNYSPQSLQIPVKLRDGWKLEKVLYGDAEVGAEGIDCSFGKNDGMILVLEKNSQKE